MSLLLCCRVTIGQIVYTKISGFEMESTWKNLGDTATLKLYGFVEVEDPDGVTDATFSNSVQKLEDLVKIGDPVKVELGYDDQLVTEFEGYVAEIKLTVPFELRLEDGYFNLKRTPVNRSWKKTTLRKLLADLVPSAQLAPTIPSMGIDSFRADRTTVAGVLKKLKEDYPGLCAYYRAGKLFVGLTYTEFQSTSQVDGAVALYDFQLNIVSDGSLSYRRKEDVRIKAKVVAIHANGKKTTTEAGDVDGAERTITLRTETKDKAELKKLAQSQLDAFKYDGYSGDFTAFGVPYLIHSGVADLLDTRHPQRSGRYLVDAVKVQFGPEGFRRIITLGKRSSF
jgi:phage protein D